MSTRTHPQLHHPVLININGKIDEYHLESTSYDDYFSSINLCANENRKKN